LTSGQISKQVDKPKNLRSLLFLINVNKILPGSDLVRITIYDVFPSLLSKIVVTKIELGVGVDLNHMPSDTTTKSVQDLLIDKPESNDSVES